MNESGIMKALHKIEEYNNYTMDSSHENEHSRIEEVNIKIEPSDIKEEDYYNTTNSLLKCERLEDKMVVNNNIVEEPVQDLLVKVELFEENIQNSYEQDGNTLSQLDDRYTCLICCNTYDMKRSLYQHINTEHSSRTYEGEHLEETVQMGERRYECNICLKRFLWKSVLEVHLRGHSGERPFSCDMCHKRYSQRGTLTAHMRAHTGAIPHECDICLKQFHWQSALQEHVRTHSGERPFGCDLCRKRFNKKWHLKVHKRIHSGEIHNECNICHKQYTRSDHLKVHMRTHTGSVPHECDVCLKRFHWKSVLEVHMRTHSGEKPYACDICNKQYNKKWNLKVHMRTHTSTSDRQSDCDMP